MALDTSQITGTNFVYQNFSFERFLDDMVELGRQRIELWGIAQHFHVPVATADDVRRLGAQLAEREQSLYCLTPEQVMYPVNLGSDLEWLRASSLAMFRRAAEVTAELGGEVLFLTPGRGREDEDVADAWKRSVDGIQQVAEYASTLGVRCVVEALQRSESNLVFDLDALARLDTDVAHPNLTIALDTVAMATAGDTVADYYATFGDRVTHVHLVDGAPSGHRAWGDGELPLADYLRVLDEHGFSGMMSFEIFGAAYARDPLRAHRQCQDAVFDALAAIRD
ncbi:sugar phosphate isomerase/epimerase family protein [Microbacterium aurugineum]|uniref:sugar phosphate isomerase/epimerase family protein n=1 Tax=Microbacterium aurugineum TaxID=2851642 RepID=UPI0020C09547|nr:sugar phosphate isomerase/epimerase family protein [Microbacterium aurugineum]MCK8478316.1 sugar phosphate isomerase/epimerase [Microbacterium aurugineum]